jgi:hypothetical protein
MTARVWSLPLPDGAEPPFAVFVNAEELVEGADYTIEGRWVRCRRPLKPQPPLGFWRRVMLGIGIGVYGDLKGDAIDISYHRNGVSLLATGVPIIPPPSDRDAGSS